MPSLRIPWRAGVTHTGTASTTIGVVVGVAVPPAGSTVTPTLSPVTSPDASTGAVDPPTAAGTSPAGRAVPGPRNHSSYTCDDASTGSPELVNTICPARCD